MIDSLAHSIDPLAVRAVEWFVRQSWDVFAFQTVDVPVTELDLMTLIALVLTAAGIVAAFVPIVPGGVLSLAGVYLYWWHTDYSDPGLWLLAGLTMLAVLAIAVDWLAGLISAKAGGASTTTTILATVIGLIGMIVAGPIGFLLGTVGTVFGITYVKTEDFEGSARTAGVTLVGMLTSNVLQILLTAGVFVIMVGIVVI